MVLTQPRNKYTENNQLIGNYEKANPFTALCIPGVVSNFQGSQGDSQSSAKVRTQQQTRSNAPCRRTGTRRIDLYRGAGTARLLSECRNTPRPRAGNDVSKLRRSSGVAGEPGDQRRDDHHRPRACGDIQ